MKESDNTIHQLFASRPCLTVEELHAYCSGTISTAQRHEIEVHLLDCPLCRDAVEGWMPCLPPNPEGIRAAQQTVWQQTTKQLSLFRKSTIARIPQLWRHVAAALILLALGWMLYQTALSSPSPDALFARYYEPYQIDFPLNYRNAQNARPDLPDSLLKGFEAFDQQRYEESIPLFETWLQRNPDNDIVQFFLAQAYLASSQGDKALPLLESMHKRHDSSYQEAATWYLTLLYLKKGEMQHAMTLLQSFEQSESFYYRKRAVELRSHLTR